jgi:hypothetical protein
LAANASKAIVVEVPSMLVKKGGIIDSHVVVEEKDKVIPSF